MKLTNRQSGFGHIEIFILVIVVAVLSFAGYKVLHHGDEDTSKNSQTPSSATSTPAISNKENLSSSVDDLKKVDTAADENEKALQGLTQ